MGFRRAEGTEHLVSIKSSSLNAAQRYKCVIHMVITKQAVFSLTQQCQRMKQLKQLHGFMVVTAFIGDAVLISRLIDFCTDPHRGDLAYACSLFARAPTPPTTYMWNAMIRGYAACPDSAAALSFYRDMLRRGRSPDHFTFPLVLKACSRLPDPASGRCVHGRTITSGYAVDVYVSTTLLHMYVSCGDLPAAALLFESVANRNVVTWTTMISGYSGKYQTDEAIRLFREMEREGVEPNEITMVHVLVACAKRRDLETGRRIHDRIRRAGGDLMKANAVLATAVLNMYARCGSLGTARELFDRMPAKNEVSWNSLIHAYNQYGRSNEAVQLFKEMQDAGVKPDNVTLLSLLGASAREGALQLGQEIHACVEKTMWGENIAISTALIDMYAKTGDAQSALQIFAFLKEKDVVAWTSIITGLGVHGHGQEAIDLFDKMLHDGVAPDHVTFLGVLTACSHAGFVDRGREYLESMEKLYGIAPTIEHYGCVIDLLRRAGQLKEAERMVELMPIQPSSTILSSMLSGCNIHGDVPMAEKIRQLAMLNPQGSGTSVLLSNIYAGAGRWEEVEKARGLMWKKGMKKIHASSSI